MGSKPRKKMPEAVAFHRAYQCYFDQDAMADESLSWVPPVDIYETDDCYILNAELPGVTREDIHVEVSGSDLTIRGKRRSDALCAEENYHRLEGMRGEFRRTFSLPDLVEGTHMRASLKDGVLNLIIPKTSKSKKISIQSSRTGQ